MTGVIVKFLGISFKRLPVSPILGFSISLKLNIMFLSECPSDITDGCSTHSSVEKNVNSFSFFLFRVLSVGTRKSYQYYGS